MESLLLLLLAASCSCSSPGARQPYGGVLDEVVAYSPLPPSPSYASNATFDPLGMEHVYLLSNTFLDIIQRRDVLPRGLNVTTIVKTVSRGPEPALAFLTEHWQQLLLQHIGVLTATVFGLLLAGLLPVIGFFFCCCRCCGKCGAYPDTPYDKRGDGCRRTCLGLLLSLFVIAALFGSVCSFVTNYYTYSGASQVTTRMGSSLEDTTLYIQHTDESFQKLLVTNFREMEEVVNRVLDESGSILTKKLLNVTEASALGQISTLVGGLARVRSNLRDIMADTRELEDEVQQLVSGLAKSQRNLGSALDSCSDHQACRKFTDDYRLSEDLGMKRAFLGLSFTSANHGINNAVSEISDLLANGLVGKIEEGTELLASLESGVTGRVAEVAPGVRQSLREMGEQLEGVAEQVRATLGGISVSSYTDQLTKLDDGTLQWVEYRFYLGLSMASLILLILLSFILGLFYGMCGKRPGGLYGDDCCNRGTGASFLAAATYLTFLAALPLLLLTVGHFLLGAALHHGPCRALTQPSQSDLFLELDREVLTPSLRDMLGNRRGGGQGHTAVQVIRDCHANRSMYTVLGLEQVYNISSLSSWRQTWGLGAPLDTLGEGQGLGAGVQDIVLLAPSARVDLQGLASSPLGSLDLSEFSSLEEESVTKVDLQRLVRRLRSLKDQLDRQRMRQVSNKVELEVRWLEGMATVDQKLKLTVRRLKDRLEQLDKDIGISGQASLGSSLTSLLAATSRAEETLQDSGQQLVAGLTRQLASETSSLVDDYVSRVESGVREGVGACAPLSEAYNATVTALCSEVVQPFNGFWASVGWCYLLYLPCILLSVSLIKLYRKTESYPGPHVEAETQPLDGRQGGKGGRRGHRRTASSMRLPEFTHSRTSTPSRALPALPPEEEGGAPPRYSSNPTLEYERPPPYNYLPTRAK